MTPQPAYDEIVLTYGEVTIVLHPSLRAAMRLERLHNGFPDLLNKIAEFDTRTIRAVICVASDRKATERLFEVVARQPLGQFIHAAQAPLFEFVAALLPQSSKPQTDAPRTDNPLPWAVAFNELFKIATGWLGWTPATAWSATPQEITDAFEGHLSKLKAIHSDPDAADDDTSNPMQHEENVKLGLDPEFDRKGLAALTGMGSV